MAIDKHKTSIFLEDSFDSAHFLPNVQKNHKCRRMHGHTYRVRIEITGGVGIKTGWIVDYAEVKQKWTQIKNRLDHRTLNNVLPNPTCELIAAYIGKRMKADRIELRETVNCGCVWERS